MQIKKEGTTVLPLDNGQPRRPGQDVRQDVNGGVGGGRGRCQNARRVNVRTRGGAGRSGARRDRRTAGRAAEVEDASTRCRTHAQGTGRTHRMQEPGRASQASGADTRRTPRTQDAGGGARTPGTTRRRQDARVSGRCTKRTRGRKLQDRHSSRPPPSTLCGTSCRPALHPVRPGLGPPRPRIPTARALLTPMRTETSSSDASVRCGCRRCPLLAVPRPHQDGARW